MAGTSYDTLYTKYVRRLVSCCCKWLRVGPSSSLFGVVVLQSHSLSLHTIALAWPPVRSPCRLYTLVVTLPQPTTVAYVPGNPGRDVLRRLQSDVVRSADYHTE